MAKAKKYDRLMAFGTCSVDDEGNMQLSKLARLRSDRVAEAYYSETFRQRLSRIGEAILIAGGYGKQLFSEPPETRESVLMADYLVREYKIPAGAILLEEESTTTQENWEYSKRLFPEFFASIPEGAEKLGVVSQFDHLDRVTRIGCGVLECSSKQFVQLRAGHPSMPMGMLIGGEASHTERLVADS